MVGEGRGGILCMRPKVYHEHSCCCCCTILLPLYNSSAIPSAVLVVSLPLAGLPTAVCHTHRSTCCCVGVIPYNMIWDDTFTSFAPVCYIIFTATIEMHCSTGYLRIVGIVCCHYPVHPRSAVHAVAVSPLYGIALPRVRARAKLLLCTRGILLYSVHVSTSWISSTTLQCIVCACVCCLCCCI